MTSSPPAPSSPPVPLARSRTDHVLGGICGGLAERLGVDPLLVRILAVLLVLLSGGAAVLAYLLLWIFLPLAAEPAPAGQSPPATEFPAAGVPVSGTGPAVVPPAQAMSAEVPSVGVPPAVVPPAEVPPAGVPAPENPRTAWSAVGGELRALAGELRRPRPAEPGAASGADPRPTPLQAADRALTTVGDRLRTPEVRHSARNAASRLSEAVRASAEGVSKRGRRS